MKLNLRRNVIPVTSMDRNEKLVTVCYLSQILHGTENDTVLRDENVWEYIWPLVKASRLTERFSKVLELYVEELARKNVLHVLKKKEDSGKTGEISENNDETEAFEDQYNFELRFKEDEVITRHLNCDLSNLSEINYLRCLLAEDRGTVSRILVMTFFMNDYKRAIETKKIVIPQKIKKLCLNTAKLDFLKKEIGLSENECRYLMLRYRKATVEALDYFFNQYISSAKLLYSVLADFSEQDLNYLLRQDQKLYQYGFINEERDLNPALIDCIENQDLSIYFSDLIKPLNNPSAYELSSFSVPSENQMLMESLLNGKNPVSILLYGAPGSGKTEFSKALVNKCNKKVLIFKNESEVLSKSEVLNRLNCFLSIQREDCVLIVDEADTLLETSGINFLGMDCASESKGIVNKMLENSQNKTIWIVNRISQMEDSTKRRFTLSCKFSAMSSEIIKSIAEKKLEKTNISDSARGNILSLLSSYHITGASIDNVVKTIESMDQNCAKNEQQLVNNVEIVLKENSQLLNGSPKIRENVSSNYDASVLNTSVPSEEILQMVHNAKCFSEKNKCTENGIRMLFFGLSGTGKTELARYISEKLGKKILLKRASDILNKWVGGTEQNIKNAFDEAAANDEILLFDEADSFFAERSSAQHSWERTQVNEFLTQMEEFTGILICTTNLRNIMDGALLRRFHITVEFKALKKDGIQKLLEKYFTAYSFDKAQIDELQSYNSVTPGDFSRLSGKIRFMNAEEINSEMIIDELCKIQLEKNESDSSESARKIGFVPVTE